jgi:hypothetical protein
MSDEERARLAMVERFTDLLGADVTDTVLAHLPPPGARAATSAQLEGVATDLHTDMAHLRTELRGEMAHLRTELRGDMAELRTELRGDMAELRTELRGEMAHLRTELHAELAQLQARVDGHDDRFDRIDRSLEQLRGEVTAAITAQSRAVVLGVLTATVSIAGLSAVFARLF